jgi:hypothetical protein
LVEVTREKNALIKKLQLVESQTAQLQSGSLLDLEGDNATSTKIQKSNAEQLRIVSAKINSMKDVLQIHYDLLAETDSNRLDTFADIFEAMTPSLKHIFQIIK